MALLVRAVLGLSGWLLILWAASPAIAYRSANLIVNPGAEAGPGAQSDTETMNPPGWMGNVMTAVAYGATGFPTVAVSAQLTGGNNFFAGGALSQSDFTVANQVIDLTADAAEIDQGDVTGTFKAALGGIAGQEATAETEVRIAGNGNTRQGIGYLGPVKGADRGGQTTLVPRSTCFKVPRGARKANLRLAFTRGARGYIHGYADNLSLVLEDSPCPPMLEPPAPPQAGVAGNVDKVSGSVRVRLPGSDQFVNLEDLSKIPVGTEIDTTRGVVALQTAAGTAGATQSARFSDGQFTMTQGPSAAITELKLSGKLDKCSTKKGKARTNRRRLWGNGSGRFRTRGRRASASVRGTRWFTEDSCKGTLVRVTQGSVVVRDFRKKKNITVRAPGRYFAK